MQTKLVVLKPKLSILVPIFFILVDISVWHYQPSLFEFIITLAVEIWLYQYISPSPYQLDLLTNENKLILWFKQQPHLAKIVKYKHISFICTWLTLNYNNNKTISIFIFIDSVSLVRYKQLQNFLIWS